VTIIAEKRPRAGRGVAADLAWLTKHVAIQEHHVERKKVQR
jgi:hypothetical protein